MFEGPDDRFITGETTLLVVVILEIFWNSAAVF